MEDPNRKPTKANVFVRVRPFSEAEAEVCPEDSPVPREVIQWDAVRSLTVLDAANGFQPRKNGYFEVDHVLWSFRDEEKPKTVIHTQQDVYSAMVAPMIPQIVSGYSTAFCVAGAPGSGRLYSLYGDDVDGLSRGLLPRFVENIFNAFKKEKRDNSTISCEIEAIEISPNETYVDLLLQKRRNQSGTTDELIKVVHDALEGVKLQGVTRVEVQSAADAIKILRQLARLAPKRNTCQTVHFRFMETFEFADPEEFEQSVNKSRHVNVLFMLMRNMPAAFQRCVDVAVEHDSGENPLAKVPTRETAITKLYPDLLQQGYNLVFLCCVSPFYEHTRETIMTLTLATKFMKLKCKPKLLQDEALNQLRTLSDEVKCLKSEVVKQTESTEIVQKELNAREVELMKREAAYHAAEMKLLKQEENILKAKHALNFNRHRTRWHRAYYNGQCQNKRALISSISENERRTKKSAEDENATVVKINSKIKELERQLQEHQKKNAIYETHIRERKEKEIKLAEMQTFIKASPEERLRILQTQSNKEDHIKAINEKMTVELKELEEVQNRALNRYRVLEKDYETAYAAAKGIRDKAELQTEITRLKEEIENVQANVKRLEGEMQKRPRGCHCIIM